jgi:hypothetical protein
MNAFALHRAGRCSEAIRILSGVARVAPHLGYEHVLTSWVWDAREPLDAQALEHLARLLTDVLSTTIGFNRLRPGERTLLAPFAGLASVLSQRDLEAPHVLAPASGLLRRAGRVAEALEVARRVPGVHGRVQEGLAKRVLGEGALACEAFEAAAAALALLQGIPGEDPEVAGLRAACGAPVDPEALERVALLDALRRETGYVALETPADPSANLLSDPRHWADSPVKTTVAGWECPTNRLVLALLRGHTDVRRVAYAIAFDDFERPVLAQVRGSEPLWVEREGVVVQACEAPSAELRADLARVVTAAGTGTRTERLAAILAGARRLKASAQELQAAMVHPPAELAHDDVPRHVYLYQVACACALTSLPSRDGLQALESLIFGPVDWASGAAIVALGEWVRAEPAIAIAGRALLLAAIDDLLPHECEPRFWPLMGALTYLPGVPPSAHDALKAWFTRTHPEEQRN